MVLCVQSNEQPHTLTGARPVKEGPVLKFRLTLLCSRLLYWVNKAMSILSLQKERSILLSSWWKIGFPSKNKNSNNSRLYMQRNLSYKETSCALRNAYKFCLSLALSTVNKMYSWRTWNVYPTTNQITWTQHTQFIIISSESMDNRCWYVRLVLPGKGQDGFFLGGGGCSSD